MQSVLHPRNSPSRSPESSYSFSSKFLEYLGTLFSAAKYDFEDISTMALYWICDRCIVLYLQYLFNRCLLGTATILSKTKRDVEKAHEVVRDEPSTLQASKTVTSLASTFEFSARKLSPLQFVKATCRDALPSAF
jgi:hypothetical protein